jgi:hypothetical protein
VPISGANRVHPARCLLALVCCWKLMGAREGAQTGRMDTGISLGFAQSMHTHIWRSMWPVPALRTATQHASRQGPRIMDGRVLYYYRTCLISFPGPPKDRELVQSCQCLPACMHRACFSA